MSKSRRSRLVEPAAHVIVGPDAPELRTELVDAIHRDRLVAWADRYATADPSDDRRAQAVAAVLTTCRRIRAANEAERDRIEGMLGDAGVPVARTWVSDQRHAVRIEVSPSDAPRAAVELQRAGFRSSRSWTAGALESMQRSADVQVFTRDGAVTTAVELRWRARRRGRLHRLFGPTPADWDAIALPKRLWWAYSIVRPARLVAERLGIRSADHSALEPFLVTPHSLISALLDVASVGADDVVFDFGSGDGRFVVDAAATRGCRSVGVEQSVELCAVAVERAGAAGVADRVSIVNADAADVDVSEVTVVVLFLPMVVAARVVPDLRARLSPGARIVLHEQSPLARTIPAPDTVSVLIGDDAVTVAHRWNVAG